MKLVKDLILYIIALVLLIVFTIGGILISIFRIILGKKVEFFERLYHGYSYMFYNFALILDRVGAYLFKDFFNILFLTDKARIKFGYYDGKEYYTISKVLGINYKENTLNSFGFWFKEFLDLFEREHVLKAIKDE